ncbi:MAG: site-2 protease family protein [Methylobacillus sp.]|nr:site-2 protease family protein [Methylobacillus sp.]
MQFFDLLKVYVALDPARKIAVSVLPVIFAITAHEAAHGYVARYFGDPTAASAGRITLNPLKHIDPVGTVLVPLLTMLAGGVLFGWAKPVPVNFNRLRDPKKDMLWVAAAGPGANLVMTIFWVILSKFAPFMGEFSLPLMLMSMIGIIINVALMVLNLLPLPPLDGGRIAVSLLPQPYAWQFAKLERFGFLILLVLLFTGILGKILWPIVDFVTQAISLIF